MPKLKILLFLVAFACLPVPSYGAQASDVPGPNFDKKELERILKHPWMSFYSDKSSRSWMEIIYFNPADAHFEDDALVYTFYENLWGNDSFNKRKQSWQKGRVTYNGDLNGDGLQDLIIGEQHYGDTLRYYVFVAAGGNMYVRVNDFYATSMEVAESASMSGGVPWRDILVKNANGAEQRQVFWGRCYTWDAAVRLHDEGFGAEFFAYTGSGGFEIFQLSQYNDKIVLNTQGDIRELERALGNSRGEQCDFNGDGVPDLIMSSAIENTNDYGIYFMAGCGGGWYAAVLYFEAPSYELVKSPLRDSDSAGWMAVEVPMKPHSLPEELLNGSLSARYIHIGDAYARQVSEAFYKKLANVESFIMIGNNGAVMTGASIHETIKALDYGDESAGPKLMHLLPAFRFGAGSTQYDRRSLESIRLNSDSIPDVCYMMPESAGSSGDVAYGFCAGLGGGMYIDVGSAYLVGDYGGGAISINMGDPVRALGMDWYDIVGYDGDVTLKFDPEKLSYAE